MTTPANRAAADSRGPATTPAGAAQVGYEMLSVLPHNTLVRQAAPGHEPALHAAAGRETPRRAAAGDEAARDPAPGKETAGVPT